MKYQLFGKFTAHDNKRDELVDILIQASELLKKNSDCIHYTISTSDNPNDVWVSEIWTNKAAHDESLNPEDIKALIKTAMPLIASMSDQTELSALGGKGI